MIGRRPGPNGCCGARAGETGGLEHGLVFRGCSDGESVRPPREELMTTLVAISDFSFAWGIVDTYTPLLQAQV
jgi:hypothetical protein